MPELPEVEITARLLDKAFGGTRIESALAPGINALRTFEPPLSELAGERSGSVRRRGKHLIVETDGGLALLIHLMSAGRLQLYDKHAGPRDRTSRLLVPPVTARAGASVRASARVPAMASLSRIRDKAAVSIPVPLGSAARWAGSRAGR